MTDLDRLLAKLVGVEPDWKWHPTSDIAQAMMCAEKMVTSEKAGQFRLRFRMDFGEKQSWFSTFGYCDEFYAVADTPADAICRAIEKALEATAKQGGDME